MKTIAAIQVDLEVTPLGTRSRLADDMLGVPVLRRTVERVARATQVEKVFLLCPPSQRSQCQSLLEATPAEIQPFSADPPPWSRLVQTARKWSLDSWRGGIGSSTSFDEYLDGRLIAGLLDHHPADAALVVAPSAVAFDPDLADRMIAHGRTNKEESRLTFAQTPPGLSGILVQAELVREIAQQGIPIGWVFSYKPDQPLKDLVFQPCFYEVPPEVRYAYGRLIADTDRAWARLEALLTAFNDPDARTVGRWLIEREANHVDDLPREVECELTTDDPYPKAVLRPRGDRLGRAGKMDPELLIKVAEGLSRFDDSLLVLGGFGDPLRHPDFSRILGMIREPLQADSGTRKEWKRDRVFGLCVRTPAVDLDDMRIAALIEHEVDVLSVVLDAWTPQLYGQLHGRYEPQASACADRREPKLLDVVLANIDRLAEVRVARRLVKPIVVPELTKARENVHELDDFHDGWLRKLGSVCITGASSYAGQWDDHRVMSMAPPKREACRRLKSRCMVLSDGRVTMCDQDFKGRHVIGDLREQSLEEIWNGPVMAELRDAHQKGQFDANPLCATCDEWHRP
jgi:radical SAM protein with 4Fe4S-binding SPASM domain